MIFLLRNATSLVIALLIGIAVYSSMQVRFYASKLDAAQVEITRGEHRAETLLEHQRWQLRRIETMEAALNERETQMRRDDELLQLVRGAARRLEQEDAETADWAGQPVPAAVGSWVRKLTTGDGDSTGSDVGDRARAPSEAAAGTNSQGGEQPGLVGSAG